MNSGTSLYFKNVVLALLVPGFMTIFACQRSEKTKIVTVEKEVTQGSESLNQGIAPRGLTGGQDGGGGDVEKSTEEDVRKAVSEMKSLVIQKHSIMLLSTALGRDDINFGETNELLTKEQRSLLVQLIVKMRTPLAGAISEDSTILHRIDELKEIQNLGGLEDYLELSSVYFEVEGPCPNIEHKDADASVSAYTYGADICFSISTLMGIPKSSLYKHVYGLWWHEIVHLNGHRDEDVAVTIEKLAEETYETLVSGTPINIPYKLLSSFMSAEIYLKKAKEEIYQERRAGESRFINVTKYLTFSLGVLDVSINVLSDRYHIHKLFPDHEDVLDKFVIDAKSLQRKIEFYVLPSGRQDLAYPEVNSYSSTRVSVGEEEFVPILDEIISDFKVLRSDLSEINQEIIF